MEISFDENFLYRTNMGKPSAKLLAKCAVEKGSDEEINLTLEFQG